MERKAVLQFAAFSAPYGGNFICSLRRLEELFAEAGIRTIYVFPVAARGLSWAEEMQHDGAEVFFLEERPAAAASRLRSIFVQYGVMAIHTHFSETKYNLILKRAIHGKQIAWVRHVHSAYQYAGFWKEPLKRFAEPCGQIIACSSQIAEDMAAHGYAWERISCVYNGIDFSRLERYEPLDSRQLGIPEHAKRILMFGYDVTIKGIDIALTAIAHLREKRQVVLLLVAGQNLACVRADIDSRLGGVPEWVVFLPPREDVATYYHTADVFLSASRTEGFCYALLEAQYCETYVAASRIPGHVPVASMFECGNAEALAGCLEEAFCLEAEEKSKIIQRQKENMIKCYSAEAWAQQVREVYRQKLGI